MQVQRHVYENKQNICLASLLEHTFSSALFATAAFWLRSKAMTQTAKVPSLQQAHDDSPPEKQEEIIESCDERICFRDCDILSQQRIQT